MKIALIGSAPSSVGLAPVYDARYAAWLGGKPVNPFLLAPFVDQQWEIWGVSPGAFAQLPRADRWFELHRWEPGKPWFSPEYVQFLRDFRGPVYTGGPIPEIANHVVYPIERVEERFSAYFLHSSLSMMLALAILEIEDSRARQKAAYEQWLADVNRREAARVASGAPAPTDTYGMAPPDGADDVIGLWGVDMAATEEYGDQRSGCHFFILEALRAGIKVYTPPESCLLRPKPIYGIGEWDHAYIKATARMRELNMQIQHHQEQLTQAQNALIASKGQQDALNYFVNTWLSPYGLPAGVMVAQDPGTGLGGGVTRQRSIDAEIDRMPPGAAAEEAQRPEK